jgi:hypothetical protein
MVIVFCLPGTAGYTRSPCSLWIAFVGWESEMGKVRPSLGEQRTRIVNSRISSFIELKAAQRVDFKAQSRPNRHTRSDPVSHSIPKGVYAYCYTPPTRFPSPVVCKDVSVLRGVLPGLLRLWTCGGWSLAIGFLSRLTCKRGLSIRLDLKNLKNPW